MDGLATIERLAREADAATDLRAYTDLAVKKVALALRRWHKPFEALDDSNEQYHLLYLPMSVRGELLGFLGCGPKSDHTSFLNDETAALALLADRAGIAYALLSRATLPPFPVAAIRTSSDA